MKVVAVLFVILALVIGIVPILTDCQSRAVPLSWPTARRSR